MNPENDNTPQRVAGRALRRPNLNLEPRMLTAQQATEYLGYSSTDMLRRIPVQPVRLMPVNGQPRWDRRQLDLWLDGLSALGTNAVDGDVSDDADGEAEIAAWLARRGT